MTSSMPSSLSLTNVATGSSARNMLTVRLIVVVENLLKLMYCVEIFDQTIDGIDNIISTSIR